MYICPHCGGRTRKSGHNASGSQRYLCLECGRKSTEGATINLKIDKECPYCHSTNLKRGGHLKSGAARFYCKECGRYFSDKTKILEKLDKTCPYCNSNDIVRRGKLPNGKQRYQCRSCNTGFSDETIPDPTIRYDKECPICHNKTAKKAGFSKEGKQYYICKKCNHKFLIDGKYKHITEKQKELIIEKHKAGYTGLEISKMLGVGDRTIRKYIKGVKRDITPEQRRKMFLNSISNLVFKGIPLQDIADKFGYKKQSIMKLVGPYYKNETITDKQRQLILKYGAGCKVPVEYLAPYIKCSENMCRKVLKGYSLRKIKYERTETEKHQDWFELDKFIMR